MDQPDSQTQRKGRLLNLRPKIPLPPRPLPGIKPFFVFAPIIFSGGLFNLENFFSVFLTFIIFAVLGTASYLLNDVIDAPKDRLHPTKSQRLVASGKLPWQHALAISFFLFGVSLAFAFWLSPFLFFVAFLFSLLQFLYSLYLKNLILLDVIAVAAGYILRVYAGAVIINAHVTVWFLLAVVSLSLLLAVGKRRSERTLLLAQAPAHRKTLLHYPEALLDSLVVMFATATFLTYTLFTFLEPLPPPSPTVLIFLGEQLPRTFVATKFLMITSIPVLYGIMRYLYIVYEKKKGESPEEILVSDGPLFTAVTIWLVLVLLVIYGPGSAFFTRLQG
jgi:4-hydroxybenzoate polyprenyltransferase